MITLISSVSSFALGAMTQVDCTSPCPCRAKFACGGQRFKLGVCIRSVRLTSRALLAQFSGQRPYLTVSAGEKTKTTELGRWSPDKEQWSFQDILMLEVGLSDEVCVCLQFFQEYDLLVATLALSAHHAGECCFPVAPVLPHLRLEDRDAEGIAYVSPSLGFDIRKDGARWGRADISFETMSPPPGQEGPRHWCGFRDRQQVQEGVTDLTPSGLAAAAAPHSPCRPVPSPARSLAPGEGAAGEGDECRGMRRHRCGRKLGRASRGPKAEWIPSDGLADEPAASAQGRAGEG